MIDTFMEAGVCWILPLSSIARALIVTEPVVCGFQTYCHCPRPLAGCQLWPLLTDTSTAPTAPPESVAFPKIVMSFPTTTEELFTGAVMEVSGAVVSVVFEARVKPLIRVEGSRNFSDSSPPNNG